MEHLLKTVHIVRAKESPAHFGGCCSKSRQNTCLSPACSAAAVVQRAPSTGLALWRLSLGNHKTSRPRGKDDQKLSWTMDILVLFCRCNDYVISWLCADGGIICCALCPEDSLSTGLGGWTYVPTRLSCTMQFIKCSYKTQPTQRVRRPASGGRAMSPRGGKPHPAT